MLSCSRWCMLAVVWWCLCALLNAGSSALLIAPSRRLNEGTDSGPIAAMVNKFDIYLLLTSRLA